MRRSLRRKNKGKNLDAKFADVTENSLKLMKDNHPKIQSKSKSRHIIMKLEEKRNKDKEKIIKSARGIKAYVQREGS